MRAFRLTLAGLLILGAVSVRADSWPWPSIGGQSRHRTGIVLLGPIDYAAMRREHLTDPLRKAWNDAFTLSLENPEMFGFPWPDQMTGELVVSVANASGEAIERRWVQSGLQLARPKPGGPGWTDLPPPEVGVRIRSVEHSVSQLRRIMDDLIDLMRAGVPGADRIYTAGWDAEHDRIIIVTDRVSDQLLEAIAARFGVDVIAVRVDPGAMPFHRI